MRLLFFFSFKEVPCDLYLAIENKGIWSEFSIFHKILLLQEVKVCFSLVLKGIVSY